MSSLARNWQSELTCQRTQIYEGVKPNMLELIEDGDVRTDVDKPLEDVIEELDDGTF